jgi:mono/diheme cytochrome c family protein
MKPIDQLKVIALSFLSVIVIVGVLFVVSVVTTNAVAGHHASDSGHGAKTESHSAASADHSATDTPVEHAAKTESTSAHSTEAATGDGHAAEKVAATPVGDVTAGSKVFLAKTCATCHKISSLQGANGAIGPALDGLGAAAAKRVAGQDAIAYIKASIETPNAHVVEGYPPAMPPMRASMNDEEFTNLVAYLASL